MFVSYLEFIKEQMRENRQAALTVMGKTAATLVRQMMATGYGRAIRDSGALMADVQWTVDAPSVMVGNTLPYASLIHDGTLHTPPRPYLADGLLGGAGDLAAVAAEALSQGLR